jgi:hypothetical protein
MEIANYAVLFAYQEYWTVLGLLDEQPTARWPGVVAAVAADPELTRQLVAAANRRALGLRRRGEPTSHIVAVQGALTTNATIVDCQDAGTVTQSDTTSRAVTAGASRTRVTAHLVRPTDYGTWRVADVCYSSSPC